MTTFRCTTECEGRNKAKRSQKRNLGNGKAKQLGHGTRDFLPSLICRRIGTTPWPTSDQYVAVLKSEIDFDRAVDQVVIDDEGNKTLLEGLVWKVYVLHRGCQLSQPLTAAPIQIFKDTRARRIWKSSCAWVPTRHPNYDASDSRHEFGCRKRSPKSRVGDGSRRVQELRKRVSYKESVFGKNYEAWFRVV